MARKQVAFVADSLDNAYTFQNALSDMDVDVVAWSSARFEKATAQRFDFDLLIYEISGNVSEVLHRLERVLSSESNACALFVVDEASLPGLCLPTQVKCDFILSGASGAECTARIRQLLWPGNETNVDDYIVVDGMTINLATYQVDVDGSPLDFTYLEYALLAFLASHPGRTYSRDALLSRVWGFDYYGGSRTVDVHVRRIRAKLGPELAQHLETVRGVGYLWNV